MSQYTDKAMELADAYCYAKPRFNEEFSSSMHSQASDRVRSEARKAIRQHLEAGEPDCRTCEFFDCDASMTEPKCLRSIKCINFSQYKHADDFEQLTFFEVTK